MTKREKRLWIFVVVLSLVELYLIADLVRIYML